MLETRAIYQGIEYRARKQENNNYKLYSPVPKEGFIEKKLNDNSVIYIKIVSINELESIYKVYEICEYKGEKYYYSQNSDNKITLITTTPTSDFESYSHGEYSKTVDESEITAFFTKIDPIYPKPIKGIKGKDIDRSF